MKIVVDSVLETSAADLPRRYSLLCHVILYHRRFISANYVSFLCSMTFAVETRSSFRRISELFFKKGKLSTTSRVDHLN